MFRRALVAAAAVGAGILVVPAMAGAMVWGGAGGVVSGHSVGPLKMNLSGPRALMRWAGNPSEVEYLDADGGSTIASLATWVELFYNGASPTRSAGTTYVFWWSAKGWRLEQFSTTLARFRTPGGTRVGMSYAQAKARERVPDSGGCVASGFWHESARGRPYFGYVVSLSWAHNVLRNQRVNELVAVGPHELIC